ncbi:probable E3 ubiquitin-protein ligase RHY1A [Lolium perenne]|uniref:probable E3 ubiquitin-protein ligase RHY1A n=1 Tax=Lolium perenne TaxID=4522 RepID=UPI0021F65F26|nr:probable E3 ubiquitin-protein ligase RHY1A [Lolium perenne]
MPIASKLLYFQRRPSPAPPDPPEPPKPPRRAAGPRRRRSSAGISHHHHHKPGQELVPGNQRDGAKLVGCSGNKIEHVVGTGSGSRLNHSVSDHGRLPDAVQQARERLLQRLNSVDLSGRRQQNTPSFETIWAGVLPHPADTDVSTTTDSELGSLTTYFQSSVSIAACKVQEIFVEPFSAMDKCMPVTSCMERVPVMQETACEDAGEGESVSPSPECSICLERCGDADGLMELRCKHIFHSACLERWLRSHGDCPYCRATVLRTSDE